jgi:hypothetical protein
VHITGEPQPAQELPPDVDAEPKAKAEVEEPLPSPLKAAAALGLLGDHKLIMGIPLSVSGKSPFFDRR